MTPDPHVLPHAWLVERFDILEQRLLEHSRGVRSDMVDGFRDIDAKLNSHAAETRCVRERVLVIETARAEEAKQALQHGAVAGLLTAAGLTSAWEIIKRGLGWG